MENIGVPWQLTYSDQMECWGFVGFAAEQVCVRVCFRVQG